MGQMMSSCEQNEEGQETSISSSTKAQDLRKKISDTLNQHVNRSNRRVINSQSVLIEETPDAAKIHEHPIYQTEQCTSSFLGLGPKKCCPIYGCNYENSLRFYKKSNLDEKNKAMYFIKNKRSKPYYLKFFIS